MYKLFFNLKKDLNINKIIMDNDITNNYICEFLNAMNNPNMSMIIIDNMSLCLVLQDHIANKFGYLKLLRKNNEYKKYKHFKIKIFIIDDKWDNSKWSYCSIQNFYKNYQEIEQKSISSIENRLIENEYLKPYIDIEFLKALSWGNDIDNTE